jgi:NAD(P) transhydrogenase subunit alpha
MAASTGGNCALSKPGEEVEAHGVLIVGPDNLPASVPVHSSQMYAKNCVTFLLEMIEEGELKVDLENDVVGPSCVAHDGEIRNDRIRETLGLPPLSTPPSAPEPGAEEVTAGEEGAGPDNDNTPGA